MNQPLITFRNPTGHMSIRAAKRDGVWSLDIYNNKEKYGTGEVHWFNKNDPIFMSIVFDTPESVKVYIEILRELYEAMMNAAGREVGADE